MDPHLTDLDALILRVRSRRSREYIAEAVAAYRVGAYKAAIVGTWIAVSFDILSKIRELSQAGDKAAVTFMEDFDKAVANGNRERLLKLENELLDKASDPFAFIGQQEKLHLSRLKEDRNLCSHPAFSTEAELFQPRPELVRLHIVTAVETLLAAAPVQGRTMITAFADDVPSPSFPREREQAIRYVAERYLSRLRASSLDSFATVLLKGFLRRDVAGWKGHEASILHALAAIARHHLHAWRSDVRELALRQIESASGDQLGRVFGLLKEFPDILERLDPATRIRLDAVIDNHDPKAPSEDGIFAAVDIAGFAERVRNAYARLDSERRARVLRAHPSRAFLPLSLKELREAGSFRGAEAIFQRSITPLAEMVTTEDLGQLAAAIQSNSEVWDAAAIPAYLADFIERVPPHVQLDQAPWAALHAFLDGVDRIAHFSEAWEVLARRGVAL
jgi:hypothetical protein